MKVQREVPIKQKSKKRKNKKKHVKSQKSKIFQETKFDSSSDDSNNELKNNSNEDAGTFSITKSYESNFKMPLTPSKSEGDGSILLSDTDISCTLIDDNSHEDESFCYNNIVDEFVNDKGKGKAKIVSSPVIHKKNKSPMKTAIKPETRTNINPSDETVSPIEDVQYYHTDDGVIVILKSNQMIHFYGIMLMSVLHGEVEVLGHIITKNNQDVKLYSPRGTALLYVTNVTICDLPATRYLTNLNNSEKIKLTDKCAVIVCKMLEDASITFIEKHMSQQILPRNDESHLPRVVVQPKGGWNLLKPNENWNNIIDGIKASTKLIVCGGKGVGKTTFLRYAINRLLMKFKQVKIIDLDPGQSEFTIPGCISILRIKEPVFGTNYTHLKIAERSLLSNISIGYEPKKYIDTVKCLLDETDLDEIPTLVNYMGYTHGIGINILSSVIVHIQPTDVLQIESHKPKKNYKCKLEIGVVKKNAKLFVHSIPAGFGYNLHQIYSMCDESDGWTAEPRQLREMCILAYISQMIHSNSIFKSKLPLYKVDLSAVNISDLTGQKIHLAAINACLVALCAVEQESMHIFKCLGWGIVRGIDVASNTLVLLTLGEAEILEQVSHIVLSSINLPPSLYMTPDEVTGQIPYVTEGVLTSLGQIPKRSRISVKTN